MDTAWIKVIVLTLTECVAPEGKTVCQEQQVQYNFVDEMECQKVLEQLIDYRDGFDNVIVRKEASSCLPATRSSDVYTSRSDADPSLVDAEGNVVVSEEQHQKDFLQERHDSRLQSLKECDNRRLVTPCRRGNIIIENNPADKTDVWRRGD